MKNITLLGVLLGLCVSFNSCKKCSDCTRECQICTGGTICRYEYATLADYQLALTTAGGCSAANEEDEVCTSGLFNKLRHEENVDAKESDGFDCD